MRPVSHGELASLLTSLLSMNIDLFTIVVALAGGQRVATDRLQVVLDQQKKLAARVSQLVPLPPDSADG